MTHGTDEDDGLDIWALEEFAHGDDLAFETLYRRHAAAVLRYAWALATTREQAEDLTQETFVTLWTKRTDASVHDCSLLPWLLATCKNHWRNLYRAELRRRTVPLESVPDHAAPAAVDQLCWLEDDLESLTETDRVLCELCLVEGYSYREAAELLRLSVAATGKRLQRARARLRKDLMERDN